MKSKLLSIMAVLFSALLSSLPARADFIFDLDVSGQWTGSGSIDFTTATGNSTVNVAGFSFHVASGAGSPQDYGLADINTISWSIDSSDNLTLLLSSNSITFGSFQSGVLLTNESGSHVFPCDPTIFGSGSLTCFQDSSGFGGTTSDGVLTATPAVPEPASLALLAVCLAGLGVVLRIRRT